MIKNTLTFSLLIVCVCSLVGCIIEVEEDGLTGAKKISEEEVVVQSTTIQNLVTPDVEGSALDKSGFQLIFNESFESDLSQWTVWDGGAFNQEVQLYREEQLDLTDGTLTIDIQRQAITGKENPWSTKQKDFDYVSGRIESTTSFWPNDVDEQDTFIVSARIQLPTGNGMWPAFWLYDDPWPTLGELDILEARGNAGKQFQFNMFYGETTGRPIGQNSKRTYTAPVDLRQNFHNYELVWKKNQIQVALDGNVVITVDSSNNNLEDIFGNKLHVVLNTAVGGIFFSASNRDPVNYADSAEMKVDWVRVYHKSNTLSSPKF